MYTNSEIIGHVDTFTAAIERLAKRCNVNDPTEFWYHDVVVAGNVVVVSFQYHGYRFTGHAICNLVDTFDVNIGINIATGRALRKFGYIMSLSGV